MKPKVFVTRVIPEDGLAMLREACQVDLWAEELPPPAEVLAERVAGVNGILALLTDRIDAGVMDAAGPRPRVISNMAVGFDNVDVTAATRRRIPVGNTPGVLTETTADMAFALLMAAARRIVEADRYTGTGTGRRGDRCCCWGRMWPATLGIIGFGRIGRALARRATGFDMRVLYCDTHQAAPEEAVRARSVSTWTRCSARPISCRSTRR